MFLANTSPLFTNGVPNVHVLLYENRVYNLGYIISFLRTAGTTFNFNEIANYAYVAFLLASFYVEEEIYKRKYTIQFNDEMLKRKTYLNDSQKHLDWCRQNSSSHNYIFDGLVQNIHELLNLASLCLEKTKQYPLEENMTTV